MLKTNGLSSPARSSRKRPARMRADEPEWEMADASRLWLRLFDHLALSIFFEV